MSKSSKLSEKDVTHQFILLSYMTLLIHTRVVGVKEQLQISKYGHIDEKMLR